MIKSITYSGFACLALVVLLCMDMQGAAAKQGRELIDSLKTAASSKANDTNKVKALYLLAGETAHSNPHLAMPYGEEALKLARELRWTKGAAYSLRIIGIINWLLSDRLKALSNLENALILFNGINDKRGIAICLGSIGQVYSSIPDYPRALEYYEQALKIHQELNDKKNLALSLLMVGTIYNARTDYPKALDYFEKGLSLAEEINNKQMQSTALGQLGNLYLDLADYPKSLEYYEKALKLGVQLGDNLGQGIVLENIGNIYQSQQNYPKALLYYQMAQKIQKKSGSTVDDPIILANIGFMYQELSDYPEAMENLTKALAIAREQGPKNLVANIQNLLGILYKKLGDHRRALDYSLKSLQGAKEIGDVSAERDALQNLSEVYDKMGQSLRSFKYYKQFIALRDSILSEDKVKQVTLTRMKYEIAKHRLTDSLAIEQEQLKREIVYKENLHRKNKQRNIFLITGLGILLLAVALWSRLGYIRKSASILQEEKERSETLLLNILPEEIARELKEKGRAEAKDFEEVSVLFADFQNFSGISEQLSAKELVSEINTCFEAFDSIVGKYGIEKIKTIGDSYMAAGGLPIHLPGSVKNTVQTGLEMQEFMIARKQERGKLNLPAFEMRVGIHTGPVVAGIVGVKKFQYDIWGDTVNIAARMENCGEIRKVNISQTTFDRVKDDPCFRFTCRGRVEAKNKGCLEMFFVGKCDRPSN